MWRALVDDVAAEHDHVWVGGQDRTDPMLDPLGVGVGTDVEVAGKGDTQRLGEVLRARRDAFDLEIERLPHAARRERCRTRRHDARQRPAEEAATIDEVVPIIAHGQRLRQALAASCVRFVVTVFGMPLLDRDGPLRVANVPPAPKLSAAPRLREQAMACLQRVARTACATTPAGSARSRMAVFRRGVRGRSVTYEPARYRRGVNSHALDSPTSPIKPSNTPTGVGNHFGNGGITRPERKTLLKWFGHDEIDNGNAPGLATSERSVQLVADRCTRRRFDEDQGPRDRRIVSHISRSVTTMMVQVPAAVDVLCSVIGVNGSLGSSLRR